MTWDSWLNEKRFTLFRSAIIQEQFIQCITDHTPQEGSILEAGFGFGTTTELLRDMKFEIDAFDLEPIAVKNASDRFPKLSGKLYVGDILNEESYNNNKSYDTIIHQGVLEHFNDNDIMKILKIQSGKCKNIVFDIPNSQRQNTEDEGDGTRFETPQFWELIIEKSGLNFKRYGRNCDYGNDMLPKELLKYNSDLMREIGRSSIFVVEGLQQ